MAFPPRHAYRIPLGNGGILDLGSRCLVMGILNVTPDSFAEAAPELDSDAAVAAAEKMAELGDSIRSATEAGMPVDRILVDPGIGFAKQAAHSYGVLARLPELAAALDRPVVVGPSRKSFMREAAGNQSPFERDWATAGAVAAAVLNGAHIVRVHAVAQMVQVVGVAEEIRKNG